MKNIVYLVLLFGLILNPLKASSQNKEDYLSSAYTSFERGEYDNAQKALNVYVSVFGGDASDLAYKIQQCKTFMDKAEDAIARQQIKDAIDYYRGVLSINPNDPIAKKKIADLGMTVKNDKTQASLPKRVKTNPFKPINSFEMRFLSSFDSKGPFGLGFHFNRSYFKFGIDVLLSHISGSELDENDVNNEYVWEDNINKFILLDQTNNYLPDGSSRLWYIQSEYIYPRTQLSISPGINLKYFSVECGLGVFICENIVTTEYKIDTEGKKRFEGTKSIKSYFTARPAIVGYIPISKHACLSVSFGYNFVPGATPLNGFVVGLGFSGN